MDLNSQSQNDDSVMNAMADLDVGEDEVVEEDEKEEEGEEEEEDEDEDDEEEDETDFQGDDQITQFSKIVWQMDRWMLQINKHSLDVDYNNNFYKNLGLLIHRKSGAIICVYCQKALEPKAVWAHLKKKGHLFATSTRNMLKVDFLDMLKNEGAKDGDEMGHYMEPNCEELKCITVLPVHEGHVCSVCNENESFYATASLLTMKWHFRMKHENMDCNNNIFSRKLQTIFNNNRAKYYIIKVSINIYGISNCLHLINFQRAIKWNILCLQLLNNNNNKFSVITYMPNKSLHLMIMAMMLKYLIKTKN